MRSLSPAWSEQHHSFRRHPGDGAVRPLDTEFNLNVAVGRLTQCLVGFANAMPVLLDDSRPDLFDRNRPRQRNAEQLPQALREIDTIGRKLDVPGADIGDLLGELQVELLGRLQRKDAWIVVALDNNRRPLRRNEWLQRSLPRSRAGSSRRSAPREAMHFLAEAAPVRHRPWHRDASETYERSVQEWRGRS